LDEPTSALIYQHIETLINNGMKESIGKNKPLLIVLAEIHDSKVSFLLQAMVLLNSKELGIKNLFSETINLHHKKNGWKIPGYLNRLFSFASTDLHMHVKDLEEKLHYKNILSPYPYHDIPEDIFGEKYREVSWVIDINTVGESAVLIVGAGHLNSILNSELKNKFILLPINCTCDRKYSDKLAITDRNFIELQCNLSALSLDEIINIVCGNKDELTKINI
jgi:hypothetical protein